MDGEPRCLVRLSSDELQEISSATLSHYQEGARAFWAGTRDHDVSQNVEALLRHLPGPPPQMVLDLGCGPGRDLAVFRDLGYVAVGLDGAEELVRMAREHSGCEVLHQDFLKLRLADERFDGVFANARCFMSRVRNCRACWASCGPP
jgi:SAM-dependent methyltransferase